MRKVILLASLLLSSAALAGQSTHGGDNRGVGDSSAWFLGAAREIHYCHVTDPAFGLADAELDAAIARSFTTWRDYMTRKLPLADIERFDKRRTYTLNAKSVPCDGHEDLKFYFGVKDNVVLHELGFYDDPVAFAHRLSQNQETGWSKGLVWLSNPRTFTFQGLTEDGKGGTAAVDWHDPHVLDAILLHELGHVFGTGHVEGTVMDENILKLVLAPKLFPAQCGAYTEGFASIDDRRELVPCLRCAADAAEQSWDGTIDEGVFQSLTGHPPVGPVTATLHLVPLSREGERWQATLDLADQRGRTHHVIDRFDQGLPSMKSSLASRGGAPVFEIVFLQDGRIRTGSFTSRAEEVTGQTTTLHFNSPFEDSPVVLDLPPSSLAPKGASFRARSSASQCQIPALQSFPFWFFQG